MSGTKGAIKTISEDFNSIPIDSTIQGMKTAGYDANKIQTAEIERQTREQEVEEKDSINPDSIVNEIKSDMER